MSMAQHIEYQSGLKNSLKEHFQLLFKDDSTKDRIQAPTPARSEKIGGLRGKGSKRGRALTVDQGNSESNWFRELLVCLYCNCVAEEKHHWLRDCKECQQHEKEKLTQEHRDKQKREPRTQLCRLSL